MGGSKLDETMARLPGGCRCARNRRLQRSRPSEFRGLDNGGNVNGADVATLAGVATFAEPGGRRTLTDCMPDGPDAPAIAGVHHREGVRCSSGRNPNQDDHDGRGAF
jgi:hypothetical protein